MSHLREVTHCDVCPFIYDSIECHHPDGENARKESGDDWWAAYDTERLPKGCPLLKGPVTISRAEAKQ